VIPIVLRVLEGFKNDVRERIPGCQLLNLLGGDRESQEIERVKEIERVRNRFPRESGF
jgi:hypothetical protein